MPLSEWLMISGNYVRLKMGDYIAYIDTDSLFILLNRFLEDNGIPMDKWNALPQDTKSKYLLILSKHIEKNIDRRMFEETQSVDYNSAVKRDVFSIGFKQEIVCSAVLFISPKMYTFQVVNEEGFSCDKIESKGIEVVRSTSPSMFRVALKTIIKRILQEESDDQLIDLIEDYKKEFYSAKPEDISINVSVNNLKKYLREDFTYEKGCPYNLKGVSGYQGLLNKLGISGKYPTVQEGDKCKFIYLKPNKYGCDSCTYYEWPAEFQENGIEPDYSTMIEKYFSNKAMILLEPINRGNIIEGRSMMDMFF